MSIGQKYIPYRGVNTDISNQLMQNDQARFIKNLVYSLDDAAIASDSKGSQTGVFKPLQSNALYIDDLVLPDGYNQTIGYLSSKETKEVYVFVYNSEGNHLIYKLNGYNQTYNIVYHGSELNFILQPENFIAQGGAYLEIVYVTDPVTGDEVKRKFLMFTDGENFQRQIAVEDSIATDSFNPDSFFYFKGDYDPETGINMGVATPNDCIQVIEIPRTQADFSLPNNLLFNVWYFRVTYIDVWGRPSEHGIISDAYIPGINDCIGASSFLPRCLNLTFNAPNPFIDSIQIEFMKCGDTQWSISDTLFLYTGSSLGKWWLRQRNPLVNYDSGNNTITYKFCRDKECQPVPVAETSRLFNPLPRQSQSVSKIGDYISLANNKDGFLPFTDAQKAAITFTVLPPPQVGINSAIIDILIPIYNPGLNNFQAVLKDGTNGYIWGDNNPKHSGARNYQQFFKNKNQSGFGGYLVGTGNFVISTQWYDDGTGNLIQDKSLDGLSIANSRVVFERFTFTGVPKGTYVFRLFSHLADPTVDLNYEQTSTTVWGICPFNKTGFVVTPQNRKTVQELVINVCNGNYSTLNDTKCLVICDLAAFDPNGGKNIGNLFGGFQLNTGKAFQATCGYIYETNSNGVDIRPMELMTVTNPHGLSYSTALTNIGSIGTIGITNPFATSTFTSMVTDHNGFYYYSTEGANYSFTFRFMYKCQPQQFEEGTGATGLTFKNPIIIDQIKINNHFPYADYSILDCNRTLVEGTVFLAGRGFGIPNVSVILTRSQTAISDANGNYTIIAHDDMTTNPRVDEVIVSTGGCTYTTPNGNCITPQSVVIIRCVTCVKRVLTIPDFILLFNAQRGLLSGGVYAGGVTGFDWLGRTGFVQPLQNITIPTITESQTIGPSTIQVNIDPAAIFSSDFDYMTLWLTRETTIDSYVDWIVDQVEFIDNTGNINTTSPTQIRIYYASLIEYNKQNNFNTTVTWEFLEPLPSTAVAGTTQTPFQQDTVQFFVNGDGTFFFDGKTHISTDKPVNITALVKYDQTGQYFLIDYNSALAGLLPNSLIRLSRPRVCTGNEEYFEICTPIKIVNGKASVTSFILNAFDTYYLNRSIPVPTPVNPSNASVVSQTTTTTKNSDGSQTVVTSTINETVNTVDEQRQFGFLFEHDAPSNFWGKGCFNGGRGNAKNPYETIIYSTDQVALSGTLSQTGQLNFLNYFDNARKFNFSGLNGITGIYPERGEVLILGQSDWFVVGFNDTLLRANSQGQVLVPSIANTFGQPGNKVGNNYGCQLFDKNSIAKREGRVVWVDTERSSLVLNDYSKSTPVSNQGMSGYYTTKIKSVQQFNVSNGSTRYFVGVINPINNEYLLTDYIIKSNNFINTLRDYNVQVQETTAFGIYTNIFKGSYGFTYEFYAYLDGELNDQQLFSFKNAQPYRHYTTQGTISYGKMHGVTIGRNIRFVVAQEPLKKKMLQSFATYCKQGAYFCDNVISEIGQQSRTLLPNMTSADYGFFGAFLCDQNTQSNSNLPSETGINKLMDGDLLTGLHFTVDIVGDPAFDNQFSELHGVVVTTGNYEKSGT